MIRLTQSLREWLWRNHRKIIAQVMLGHAELITDEMWAEYLAWCKTEDGKQYLKGGSKYKESEN
jgi:hypothetical protein